MNCLYCESKLCNHIQLEGECYYDSHPDEPMPIDSWAYKEEFKSKNNFDWLSFRAEAAKDILCALLSNPNETQKGDLFSLSHAMFLVDEFIKQLKEKEEK